MTLRLKVLASSLGVTIAAIIILGALMFRAHRATYLEEAELRARAFLSMLSVASTDLLAVGRIEDLDEMLARLLEHNLQHLDILFVVVMDVDQRVVGHTDPSFYGRRLSERFYVEASRSDAPLVRDEGDMLLVSAPVSTAVQGMPGIRWGTVVAGVGLKRVKDHLFGLFWRAAITVLVVVGLATLIQALRLERHVIQRVRRLTDATRSFAAGDMAARAEVAGDDEIAVLGEAFNLMRHQIASYTQRLEEEIRARTSELEEANRRLESLAITDPLTGLFNRRHFEHVLGLEVRRAKRMGTSLSLLMIDVDHFKMYNDTHGHPAGDEVLRTLARVVMKRVRSTDVPCRYGGEEFAVILPGTLRNDAMTLANDIRHLVEKHPFEKEETQPEGRLTVSVGVATYPHDASDEVSLVQVSDQALYRAKANGRNRVEVGSG